MTACPQSTPAPLRCPTLDESITSTLALLPFGRAWQSRDGGPPSFSGDAGKPGTILYRFWAAIGAVRNFIETRICALRLEFWCATMSETRDQWMKEYGLPDACDPFPDLCSKVAAIGGTRCEYYADVAARSGWAITCATRADECGSSVGSAKAGRAKPGFRRFANELIIVVNLNSSPAYTASTATPPKAGRMKAGRRLVCSFDIQPLKCIIERVVHAELRILYALAGSEQIFLTADAATQVNAPGATCDGLLSL